MTEDRFARRQYPADTTAGARIDPIQGYHDESQTKLRVARRALLRLHDVVVTGIGVVLPNCSLREHFWKHLREGKSQLALELDPGDHEECAVGRVRDFDIGQHLEGIPERLYRKLHREQQFYLASLALACRDAELPLQALASERVGLFDGTSRGSFAFWYEQIANHVQNPGSRFSLHELNRGMPGQAVGLAAAMLHIKGPTYTFNGTCASGAIAIGNAFREVQTGRVDIALGTGHDAALVSPLFQMYRDAGLLSREREDATRAVRPYTGASTNAFGEGAVTVVLETREHAAARGALPLAEIVGYRHGNGGEHPTDVDFSGTRPARLISEALSEGELCPDDVDFVLGHGNGVQESDISELNYMRKVFGRRTRDVPLISTKPIYGHTLGASSALNVAAAALMLHENYVIPTINVDEQRVVHGFNHQANVGTQRNLRSGLVVTYGIGGQNATIALRKART